MPAPDDSGFQWLMGGIVTLGLAAFGFVFKRVDSVEKRVDSVERRANVRIDATDANIDKFRNEMRQEFDVSYNRLWQAITENRAEAEARQVRILETMVTKDDLRALGNDMSMRIEAVVNRVRS
jgi:hypothetical protein